MSDLVILVLAVFGAWEFVLVIVPWTIPPWLQPILVYAGSLALAWPDWRLAMAVMGGVGLCHVFVRNLGVSVPAAKAQVMRRPTRGLPNLP